MPHAGLRRQVHDALELPARDQLGHAGGVGEGGDGAGMLADEQFGRSGLRPDTALSGMVSGHE